MSARDTLTPELRAEVLRLEDDLRARVAVLPDVQSAWREEYDAARAAERTAAAWGAWVDERVTLTAVAWVLTTVFVRFCEDNGLVKPVWISGPRSREAIEAQQQFLRDTARVNADVTDREWLLEAVTHLKSLPATAGLVDDTSPMWLVSPSGDAVTRLLSFWRERDDSGILLRDLSDPDLDTRFLGDLYQEISQDAKKRYALLQTPVFVEEFILDRTLEPALNERPLDGFKMIDPTCGSGHFLLGGFQRLLERWHKQAPGLDERERVQAALDSVYGVDLNPFAVAIARFRLTVAALRSCGLASLEEAPAFKYHLAAGDSLLHGLDQREFDLGAAFIADKVASRFAYATENLESLTTILKNGQYDAVVGNPPYIQVKDRALNAAYRERYASCSGKYALTVPFMERFFRLARSGSTPGWVGQITGNAFMKREFGSVLVEKFLPTQDVRLLIDASGAYIPGHGTPTIVLVGRASAPIGPFVRAVLGVHGEPERPTDPAKGKVWSSIVAHVDEPGWDDQWITVSDLPRERLSSHPWSLSGGGAVELLAAINGASPIRLNVPAVSVGITSFTLEDDVYVGPLSAFRTRGLPEHVVREMVMGDGIREWRSKGHPHAIFPYDEDFEPIAVEEVPSLLRWMWPFRTNLANNKMFGGKSKVESGLRWTEYGRLTVSKLRVPVSIAYGEVTTHNHFVLDRGRKVFNRTAPVVKFPEGTTEDTLVGVLGVLNSSVTCFWLKQNCYPKGGDPSGADGARVTGETWEERYAFNASNVQDVPLPRELPASRGRELDALAERLMSQSPESLIAESGVSRELLDQGEHEYLRTLARMVLLQEELDWDMYRRFGLLDEDVTYSGSGLAGLELGARAFEIALARRVSSGDETTVWFERHGSTPRTAPPGDWPADYSAVVARRLELIESNAFIRLLERPENKRRWTTETWSRQLQGVLREWLLSQLENGDFWFDAHGRPVVKSVSILADAVSRRPDLVSALALLEGRPDVDVAPSLVRLLGEESVPFLAALRYKDSGLRKFAAWEQLWTLQRREDAGTYNPAPKDAGGEGPVPIPPKYSSADFRKLEYWSHRGKLDVPRERFILYPEAGREGDASPVIGWAGWDDAQQSLALATLIQSGEQQGWSDDRLTPLVAGLAERLAWVEQWHCDPDALYGGSSPSEFFTGLLDSYMAKVGATREILSQWRPPAPTRGRKAKS